MKSPIFLIAFILAGIMLNVNAQEVNTKWKKVGKKDFEISIEDEYPDASAVVLFDIGSAGFTTVRNEIKLIYNVHRRIKILDKDGYDQANVKIPFYAYQDYEEVNFINGFTYNKVDGKIKKEKLRSGDIYEEEVDERWKQKKFSMPAVKVGSVIEYEYQITSSDFVDFRNWEFQKEIPVLYSQFTTRIPEYFYYMTYFQGGESLYTQNRETYSDHFIFQHNPDALSRGRAHFGQESGGQMETTRREYTAVKTEYVMKDVPPLKDIPFVASLDDYVAKIRFQLKRVHIPGNYEKEYFNSWEKLSEEILDNSRIGRQLKRNNSVKKQAEEITAGMEDPKQKMIRIYNYVAQSMKWDGVYRYAVYDNLNKAFEQKAGNSAEINLILTLMLREAGLESHPVLLSTRSHGKILKAYPVINQFNHLINYTVINDSVYLMDATDYDRPYNLLSREDMNGEGFVVIENNPTWVNLNNPVRHSVKTNVIVALDDESRLVCTTSKNSTGFYAHDKSVAYSKGKEQYIADNYSKAINDFRLDSFNLTKPDRLTTSEYIKYTTPDFATAANDMLYFNPMLNFAKTDNPLKREERKIPVDFTHPFDHTYMLYMSIPEGYELLEKPKSIKLLLPENGGEYLYYLKQSGDMIQLLCSLKVNKTVYSPGEYSYLKQLYDQMVAKESEPIVLKKMTN